MKYVFFLLLAGGAYWYFARQTPVKEAVEAIKQDEVVPLSTGPRAQPSTPSSSPSATTALKRPIDRTHEVLDQVKKRNGDGEF